MDFKDNMKEIKTVKTKQEVSEKIWNRIKSILKEREISQLQLGKICMEHGYSVSQSEISRLHTGKVPLTLYQLIAFAEVLEIPASWFLDE